jgi:ATP-binding cassette subfamily B protein
MTHPMMPRARRDPNAPRPPLRERIAALRLVPRLIRLVWETQPTYTVLMIVLRLTRSVVPVTNLWVAKLIIDEVVLLARTHGPTQHLWLLVAIEMGVVVVGELLARTSGMIEGLLGDMFTNRISIRIMEHAATLDLHQFEDPKFYDHLERARQGTSGRIQLLVQLLGHGSKRSDACVAERWIGRAGAVALLLLALAVLPSFIGETHFAGLSYSLLFRWTPQRRLLDYVRFVGASDRTAKEVQSFGLAPWLISRYRALSEKFYSENRSLAIKKALVSSGLSLIGTLGYYGAYVTVLIRAVAGTVSIGMLAFLAASFRQSRDLIQQLLMSASGIYEQSLYLRDLFVFFDMKPTIYSLPGARPVPRPIQSGFVFEDVGFRYPEASVGQCATSISPFARWSAWRSSARTAPVRRR